MWPFNKRKRVKSQLSEDELLKRSIQEKLKRYKNDGGRAQFSGPSALYLNSATSGYEMDVIEFEERVNE
jgi:hypothetical protein